MAQYDINIRDYWRIIRKRRNIVILSAILFTVFSYLLALVRTPEPLFEATSAVKVERATDLTTLLLGTVSWTSWDNVSTQAVIINSFPVIEGAARQMGLIPENVSSAQVRSTYKYLHVVKSLKSQIATKQDGNTNIINITAESSNPKEAALLANTVAEVYRQNNVDERNKKVRETREFIEKQLEVVQSRLQQAEKDLRSYEQATKLVAIDTQTAAVINRLISLENELAELEPRRVEVRRQLRLLRQFREGKEVVSQETFFVEDPPSQLAKLTAEFRDLSFRREVLLNDYTQEHPEVDSVDAKLTNVLAEMDKELRSMLLTMESRSQDLGKRLEAARIQAQAIPDSVLTLAKLRREVELNENLLAQLKSKYQEVMIQESGLIEEVKIIKPAIEPEQPTNIPNTLWNTVAGGVIGLVMGLVLALIVETMDTSLGTIEDVEETLGIPVLGVIPSSREAVVTEKDETATKPGSEPLVTHFAPSSAVSEAYRSLRTNLQFIRTDKKAKVCLITSSSLQEGKTYNVVNLSLSLAQSGEKVLLIDADLRRPSVHNVFGLERQPGLTDYILRTGEVEPNPENTVELDMNLTFNSGQTDEGWKNVTNTIIDVMLGEFKLDDILKTPGLDNLHIINAGQGLLQPSEILRSSRFKEFLRKARDNYDIIIIDTPPVLPVADAFEVASEVDGVILVYEVGRIGRGILNRAKVQLEKVNSNVLGVILNNVKPDVAPDFYRYRTDYYYEYEDSEQESVAPPRWRALIHQPLSTFLNIIGRIGRGILNRAKVQLEKGNSNVSGGILNDVKPGVDPDFYLHRTDRYYRDEDSEQESVAPPHVDPDFYLYRTDRYYRDEDREQKTGAPPRWRALIHQPLSTLLNIIGRIRFTPKARQKRTGITLILFVGILALIGLVWQSYPKFTSTFNNLSGQKQFRAQSGDPEKPVLPAAEAAGKRAASDGPPIAESKKAASIGTAPQQQIPDQEDFSTAQPVASQSQGKEEIEPSTQSIDKQLTVQDRVAAKTRVAEDKAISVTEPDKAQALSAEAFIERFVEKWRRSWEEGDFQAYFQSYHPDFKTPEMDYEAWKNQRQDTLKRTRERDVEIGDIDIKVNGVTAVATFKQRYQIPNYQAYCLKILHLSQNEGRWTIMREFSKPLPEVVEPAEVSIQRFVERWRRAWEEGDLQTYTNCYHPDFKTKKMNIQEWKNYKQVLFGSSAKRKVQIEDIQIQENGSSVVITFKQRYLTAKHQDVGLKTLHLRRHEHRWTIAKEDWHPIFTQEPAEVSIQRFVERWRRAWEEGDLQTYTNCYHPDFKTKKMNIQEWKNYKQVLFGSSAKRKVQIEDIQIQENGSSVVITFKQRYLSAKHQDVGLKTLQLRRHKDRWSILKETWRPLSDQG